MDNATYMRYLPEHYNPRPHCCDGLGDELKSWFCAHTGKQKWLYTLFIGTIYDHMRFVMHSNGLL